MTLISRFVEDLKSELVTVVLGSGDLLKEYKLPGGLLRAASPWFEAALKDGRFKEGQTSIIKLPEDSSDAFEAFVYFATHDNLTFDTIRDTADRSRNLLLCCRAWTFGEKYFVPKLQNCATHCACLMLDNAVWMDEGTTEALSSETLASCWQALIEGAPLRDMLADCIVDSIERGELEDIEKHIADCPGLMKAIHTSEALLHKSSKSGFPRYQKPINIQQTLRVKAEPDPTRAFHPDWNIVMMHCEECAFLLQQRFIQQRCGICKGEDCNLHTDSLRTLLCKNCAVSYDDEADA